MQASINLGANVWSIAGNNCGDLLYLIGDSNNNTLTHLVIRSGLFDVRLVVAERRAIKQVLENGQVVQLDLTEIEIENSPPFVKSTRPLSQGTRTENPSNFAQDVNVGNTDLSSLVPRSPDDFGIGAEPEQRNVPPDSFIIREGSDGKRAGEVTQKIKRVTFDTDTGKLVTFGIQQGDNYPKMLEVTPERLNFNSDNWELNPAAIEEMPPQL